MNGARAISGGLDLGDVRVRFIADGSIRIRPDQHYSGMDGQFWSDHPESLDPVGHLAMSLGAFLVETADEVVLIDLGYGPAHLDITSSTQGRQVGTMVGGALLVGLDAFGYAPSDVTAIVYSHLHSDHIGWASGSDGRPTFENATHYVGAREWEHWSGEATGRSIEHLRPKFDAIAQRLALVDDGASPVRGLSVVATPGHTPGHCSFVISTGDARVVVLGDIAHCPLELTESELAFIHDVDPVLSKLVKEHIVDELERPGTYLAAGHFPNQVFGRLLPAQSGRTYTSIAV